MELFDEDLKINQKTDNKKTTTIILVLIIFLMIMMLIIVGVVIYLKQTAFVVKLDGQTSNSIKNIINIDESNPNSVYVPIKQISKILGYESFVGSYITKSEELNECYVECKDEVAMFSLGSRKIYKTITSGDDDFKCFEIDEPVKAINGELYTTIDGIKKAFNVSWNYDIENKKMNIYTMPYLIQSYSEIAVNNGYTAISENFTNQKSILEGMLIVVRNTEDRGDKYAVLDISGNEIKTILEPKYDNIEYLENTKDFLVTAEGKKGIISKDRQTIIKLQYDNIELMDYDKKLYAVENSGKFGIVDFKGNKVIDTDYQQIGIDISEFKENNIKSKYILADKLIPLKKDGLWAFLDITAKRITNFVYEKVGYITSNNKAGSGYSLLTVPEYNVVVVGKNKKYSVITSSGEEIEGLPFVFDSIYLSIYGGQESYFLEYDSQSYDLIEQLKKLGYGKSNIVNNTNSKQDSNNVENNEIESNENSNNQQQNNNNQNGESNNQNSNNQNDNQRPNNNNQNNNNQNNSNNNNQNYNNQNSNEQQNNNTEENR